MVEFFAGQRLTAGILNGAFPIEKRKTAPQSVTSSTALVDDTELFFAVEANTVYEMEGYLLYAGALDGGTGAGGLKLQFTGPSLATLKWTNFGANVAGGVSAYNVVTELLTAVSPRSVPTNAGTQMSCQPRGRLSIGSTAGTFRLRWAQNTSNATPTTVDEGSILKLKKIA